MYHEDFLSGEGDNSLLVGLIGVLDNVKSLKKRVKAWYFQVVLSPFCCLECNHRLKMVGPSQAECSLGHVVDPTVAFQVSECCGSRLVRRVCHYTCSGCGGVVASRFLYDERIYDASYFVERSRQSRERQKQKIEEMRKLLAGTRSDELSLSDISELSGVPGLVGDLNQFISANEQVGPDNVRGEDFFYIRAYWERILSFVAGGEVLFSTIPPLSDDIRVDRIRRFLTLVHLWHEREVRLTQYGNDILVEAL